MTFNGKKFIPVEGDENKGFSRNRQSNGIVYKDQDEYAKYMQSYNERQRKKQEFTTLQDEVNDLKSDVSDIKKLLIDFIKENK